MAFYILHPERAGLSLLMMLLLLQPEQHADSNKEITTTTKPSMTTASCCKDPQDIEEKFFIQVYPAGSSANVAGLEGMAQGLGCSNATDISVNTSCTFPPKCTEVSCTSPSPMEAMTFSDRTNGFVILHWQNRVDCCPITSDGKSKYVPSVSWKNCTVSIFGLSPGQDYIMTVYKSLDGKCSQGKSINMTTAPSPVLNLMIENRTVDSLEIGWKPPGDPHSDTYRYNVCLSTCSVVFKSPHFMDGLMAGVTYDIQVYVITIKNISSTVTAIQATTVPRSPRNLIVNSYSIHNVSISWDFPEDLSAMQYLYWVSWFTENGSVPLGNRSTHGSNWTIDSLQPGSLYLVKVASEIHSVKSEEVSHSTLTTPCPPTNFSAEMISQTAAELAWMMPSSAVNGFKLQWKSSTESKGHEMYLNQSSRRALLSGLTPSTNYTFTVLSVARRKNLTTYSRSVQQKVATKPECIRDLQCQVLQGGYSLKLSWTCPSHEISEVQVLVSDQPWEKWPTCNATTVIKKLQPARRYWIRVKTSWYNQHVVSEPVECSTNSAEIIVGLLFAGLLPLIILGLLLFCFRRRRKKPKNTLEKQKLDVGLDGTPDSVPVSAFSRHCYEHFLDSAFGFTMEYQQLQDTGTQQSQCVAERPGNRAKNRYSNVLPYDHSRVQLSPRPGDPNSDYINASYIPGCAREKEFIAAQGPLPGTVYDFWRMIWEQEVVTVVMLTNCIENGRVKCERYWPLDYTPCTYGNITVSVVRETILPDWTIRDLSIKRMNGSEIRLARHYHYTSWPDHGVPHVTSTILHFGDLVREYIERHKGSGPALVHCSAGVGRTGTFIALDCLLRQAQEKGVVGGFSFVQKLRMNRPLMIQNEAQYIFLHRCLLDRIQHETQNDGVKMENTTVYENPVALQVCVVSRV